MTDQTDAQMALAWLREQLDMLIPDISRPIWTEMQSKIDFIEAALQRTASIEARDNNGLSHDDDINVANKTH